MSTAEDSIEMHNSGASGSRFIVVEVSGEQGRQSLNALLAALCAERYADLTSAIAEATNGDLHLYFTCPAETLCASSELAPGVGLHGGILEGEIVRWLVPGRDIRDASPAPAQLLKLICKRTPDPIDWESAI